MMTILVPKQEYNRHTNKPEEAIASLVVIDLMSIISIDEYFEEGDEAQSTSKTAIVYKGGGVSILNIKFGDFLVFLNEQGVVNLTYAKTCIDISDEVKRVIR